MGKNILITGGTGMVGKRLSELLIQRGYNVSHLTRSTGKSEINTYQWDIEKHEIDEKALQEADYIIHLAGTNIFEKRWTAKFKQDIINSRVKSADLLFHKLKLLPQHLKAFISASGISIYGDDTGEKLVSEESEIGKNFLSEVVQKWETAADQIKKLNIRIVKIRTGIVLAKKGGALEKMLMPVKLGIVAPIGSGDQYVPWIHLDDLCAIYIKAIEDEKIEGVYNAVAPAPVTNRELTKSLGKIFNKPLLLPAVPSLVLKLILGKEKAAVILGGNKVSSQKIQQAGYNFTYSTIEQCLKNIFDINSKATPDL